MCLDGTWQKIIIDDWLPISENELRGDKKELIFCKSDSGAGKTVFLAYFFSNNCELNHLRLICLLRIMAKFIRKSMGKILW